MARTPSNMLPLGTKAPNFTLPDTISGKHLTFKDIKGNYGTVVFFICNHCPFVVHLNQTLVEVAKDYNTKGIGFVAISSNDAENYPQDGPREMTIHAATAYDAACTPDIYLFDNNDQLVYRGQLDDSRPGNGIPSDGSDLKQAISNLIAGDNPLVNQKPSIGCNIKWKS
jgi:thiol-disulfide isomerase/thioredoxin